MTRIAMVVPGGVDRSGEVRVIPALLALIRRLAERHDLHVFALVQEREEGCWDLLGARVHNIGHPVSRARAVRTIWREHRRKPFELIQGVWSGSPGLVAVTTARLLGVPCLVHVAGGELVALHDIAYGGLLSWRGRLRERVVLRLADVVTAASAPILELLHRRGLRPLRIPLGVDLDTWPARAPLHRAPAEPLRLIHVATLNRVKDQHTLLRALAILREAGVKFVLDVVGEDTLTGAIQRAAGDLSIAHLVRFHGFLTRGSLRPLMEAAHVMVLTSRHEAGPLAMLEAAVAGVPTVGTLVGHVAEWAPEAALGVRVGDSSALAAAIARLATNEALRQSIAAEALRRAIAEDADFTASRFEGLYRLLVASERVR